MDDIATPATGPESTTRADLAAQARTALAAAAGGPAVVSTLTGHAAFRVRGSDARSFLHGQLAADITRLDVGEVTRSLLLNHRGHALAEAMVARVDDELLLVVEDGKAEWVAATLAEHIIFDDVTLERVDDVTGMTLQGSDSASALARVLPDAASTVSAAGTDGTVAPRFWRGHLPHAGADAARGPQLVIYPRRRSEAGGFDMVLLAHGAPEPSAQAAARLVAALVAAGAISVPTAAVDAARVVARVTTAGGEGGDGVLPQEADLESALSYRKGCYLGQEVMARIEARGSLKRGLATVELVGEGEPSPGAGTPADRAITLDGRAVGVLGTSAVMPDGRVLALAVVRSDVEAGAALSAGGLSVRLDPPPPSILAP